MAGWVPSPNATSTALPTAASPEGTMAIPILPNRGLSVGLVSTPISRPSFDHSAPLPPEVETWYLRPRVGNDWT